MNENTHTDRTVLHVTIDTGDVLADEADNIAAALRGDADAIDGPTHRLSFSSGAQFQEVFNATNIELLQTIAREHPGSIRELARLVERDVSPVHRDLKALESYGLVEFESEGRAKRPVVPYDEIDIALPLTVDTTSRSNRSGTSA
ncbi:helix-turn-helix domain-containing protein [Haladaptatus sp. YSMS36]|uniref:HVO_A0114 family putative DNA-binding protein n=1 Tax=Haladaptatus sp. YSMS36 TaxID=3033384 RepID=UPI0023E7653B|nr:helix-turn-helix domain-containing protein [Haladaptatus sp. YSMS36]